MLKKGIKKVSSCVKASKKLHGKDIVRRKDHKDAGESKLKRAVNTR